MKPELLNDYPEKVLLGSNPIEGKIYLTKPEWQCDWYWCFGWIGNKNLLTHLDRLGNSNIYITSKSLSLMLSYQIQTYGNSANLQRVFIH